MSRQAGTPGRPAINKPVAVSGNVDEGACPGESRLAKRLGRFYRGNGAMLVSLN
ncbi:hypothetical protein [Methylomarinum vadi]|uniref:hypothetical protein n=1 Tax=Methylomarinum vadi TaxID=438855 RepID=UPI001362185E|nr:hypothetical protein [Methylomarinum vadi]